MEEEEKKTEKKETKFVRKCSYWKNSSGKINKRLQRFLFFACSSHFSVAVYRKERQIWGLQREEKEKKFFSIPRIKQEICCRENSKLCRRERE
jgi:hypothetical protein